MGLRDGGLVRLGVVGTLSASAGSPAAPGCSLKDSRP